MIEKMIPKPSDVSDAAWEVMKVIFNNYIKKETKYFNDFNLLSLSEDDVIKYCTELDKAGFIFFTNEPDDRSTFMLPTILGVTAR